MFDNISFKELQYPDESLRIGYQGEIPENGNFNMEKDLLEELPGKATIDPNSLWKAIDERSLYFPSLKIQEIYYPKDAIFNLKNYLKTLPKIYKEVRIVKISPSEKNSITKNIPTAIYRFFYFVEMAYDMDKFQKRNPKLLDKFKI